MIERNHQGLSISKQAELLSISRTGIYYNPKDKIDNRIKVILDLIDEIYTKYPFYGARRMRQELIKYGYSIDRKRIVKIYKLLCIEPIYPGKKLTTPNKEHKVYPYLLRGVEITHRNQVWSTDITYIRTSKGFMYLCAVIDWHTRYVLAWGISNTHDAQFVTDVLSQAISKHGKPEIFNTDQGSEFTSELFTSTLLKHDIRISMDGVKRALDNIFVERLWRTVKYEYVYISHPSNPIELYNGLEEYFRFYNHNRPHQSLNYKTPFEAYFDKMGA